MLFGLPQSHQAGASGRLPSQLQKYQRPYVFHSFPDDAAPIPNLGNAP